MSKRPNTPFAKEKKRLKSKLRKALAHLRKVDKPLVHKKDVIRDGVVIHAKGSVRTNMLGTLELEAAKLKANYLTLALHDHLAEEHERLAAA